MFNSEIVQNEVQFPFQPSQSEVIDTGVAGKDGLQRCRKQG